MAAFTQMAVAGSGLTMHQRWLDAISDNIANANTVTSTDADAFQARYPTAYAVDGGGVRAGRDTFGSAEGRITHQPDHPLADADGNVRLPEIDMTSQMSQLIMAQRGFQAQAGVIRNAQEVYTSALSIGRGA